MKIKRAIRKILAFILASILLAGNISSAEEASSAYPERKVPGKIYSNGTYEYEVLPDGKSLCITSVIPKKKKVIFPKKIDNVPVKEIGGHCIGRYSLPKRRYVREVIIPNGVERINYQAFYSCTNLNRVKIGDSVSKIDDRAFFNCKSLKDVEGGKNIGYVGTEAFLRCRKLTTLPKFWSKSKKAIEHGYACFSNTGIRSVSIPRWDTEVGERFYAECENLRKVVFTKEQKLISVDAFYKCKNLREVKFSPGLPMIGNFRWCEKLEEANIPNTVKYICRQAFQHCRSLKKVSLPNSLKSIDEMAFQDCRSLKQIKIPKKIKKIEQKTFQGCKNLRKAVIPNSVKKIDKTAFNGCKKLVIHCQKGSYAHKYAKKYHIKYRLNV